MPNSSYTYIVKCGGADMGTGVVVCDSFVEAAETFLDMRTHLHVGAHLVLEAVIKPIGPEVQPGPSKAGVPSPTLGMGAIESNEELADEIDRMALIVERISRMTTAALEHRVSPMLVLQQINLLLG